MNCPEELALWALVEGTLAPDSLADLDAHLDVCADCREVVGVLASGRVPVGPLAQFGEGQSEDGLAGPVSGDLVGRFRLGERLGEGAMGVVYTAVDTELSRTVALKLLHTHTATDQGRARLRREAQALAKLSHPNVVTVYEVGSEGAQVYVVMERAHQNLREWLASAARPTQPQVLRVFAEAAAGLAAAHCEGIVHRDFKPENVLLGVDGVAKVADFGLAGEHRDGLAGEGPAESSDTALTRTGAMLGTPAYMAPERLRGEAATAASDQFAFCVSLWEALEGRRPFAGDTMAVLGDAIDRGPLVALTMSAPLARVVGRGLRVSPLQRYTDMDALREALRGVTRRKQWRTRAGWAASCALLGVGAAMLLPLAGEPDPCAETETRSAAWTHAAGAQLQAALSEPAQAPLRAQLEAQLSSWAAAHASERRGLCAAQPRASRGAAFERAWACLETQARDVEATLAARPERSASSLAEALETLPEPRRCTSAEGGEARDVGESLAIARALSEPRALLRAGQAEAAMAALGPLGARASALAHPATEAHVHLLRAEALRALGRYTEAEEAGRAALFAAERGEAAWERVDAWLELVAVAGSRGDYQRAERDALHAEAGLSRVESPLLRETFLHRRGLLRTHLGQLADARQDIEGALDLRRARLGEDATQLASLHSSLGHLERLAQHLPAALAHHERALALDAPYGDAHPRRAHHLHNMAGVLRLMGRLDEARALYQQALALRQAALGPNHADVGLSFNSLGLVDADLGEWEAARAHWDAALHVFEQSGHADAALAHRNLALAALHAGDPSSALRHATQALHLDEARLGPDAAPVAADLLTLGRALLRLGRADEAMARGTRALEIALALDDGAHVLEARALLAQVSDVATPGPVRRVPRPRSSSSSSSDTPAGPLEVAPVPAIRGGGAYGGGQSWD